MSKSVTTIIRQIEECKWKVLVVYDSVYGNESEM